MVIVLGTSEQGRVKRSPRLAGILPSVTRVEVLEPADEKLLEQILLFVPALGVAKTEKFTLEVLEARGDLVGAVGKYIGRKEAVLEAISDQFLRAGAKVESEISVAAVELLEKYE